jgi:hypothetical protein
MIADFYWFGVDICMRPGSGGFGAEKSDLGRARKYKMKYSSAEDIAIFFFKIICVCETLKLGVAAKVLELW